MSPADSTSALPLVSVVPFALLLLCIAVLPLIGPHFWEQNRNKSVIALALAGPVALWLW